MDDDFHSKLLKIAGERLDFIYKHRDKFIEAWIAEHGHLPSKMELYEETLFDGTLTVRVRLIK